MKKITGFAVATGALLFLSFLTIGECRKHRTVPPETIHQASPSKPNAPRFESPSAEGDQRKSEQDFENSMRAAAMDSRLTSILKPFPRLNLSTEQLAILRNIVFSTMRASGVFKQEAAIATKFSDGSVEIQVPSRPETAAALWQSFQSRVSNELSPQIASELDECAGEQIATIFWGYGLADESYKLTPVKGKPGEYDYEFRAVIPEAVRLGKLNIVGRGFKGLSVSASPASGASLIASPQYEFLKPFLTD